MLNKHLTSLIFSLSKSEKRYFKINASLNKTNKTLIKMFDLVEKKLSYDDLLKALNIKSKKQLAVIETRLQSLILKHLRGYHANSTQSIELNNLIIEIEVLYNRRLFNNCSKLILKAKKLARKNENYLALLSILKWESFIEKEEGKYLHESQKKLNFIFNEEQDLIHSYSNSVNYKYHTFNLLLLSKNKALASLNKELGEYDKLLKTDFFKPNEKHSFDDKVYILNLNGMYYMSKGNYIECLNQYKELVELFEQSGRKNILKSNEYFLALNNFLLFQVMSKQIDNYRSTLNKIYSQFGGLTAYNHLLFNVTQNYELGIYCELGETKKGIDLLPAIENNLKKYSAKTNDINKLLFYLNIAVMYYYNENYSKSIFWLNEFLNDYSIKKSEVMSNIYYYGHIINLLVHFDAKNYDSIYYLYKECKNNLVKIRPLNKFDSSILEFIKAYADNPVKTKKEKTAVFNTLHKELTNITSNPAETIGLQFFDFLSWVESHSLNKPLTELIRKKRLG